MRPPIPQHAYFYAPSGHYWEWEDEDGNQAAVWSDDRQLIAFRAELNDLLDACVPCGLPPLGSLLLIAAAASPEFDAAAVKTRLRQAIERASDPIDHSPDPMSPTEAIDQTGAPLDGREAIAKLWASVGPGLEQIHALPPELRTAGPARWRLFQTLFDGDLLTLAQRVPPSRARDLIAQWRRTPYLNVFQRRPPGWDSMARLRHDLTALDQAFVACPPECLRNRLTLGLDHVPTQAEAVPFPPDTSLPARPSDLLLSLDREGGEFAQVAGLVRRLSAVLHVPQSVTQREDLPLGGVSDITNRGDPSRLLMTELAWDDLTFAVRLAQGEALYLRREAPPAEPPPRWCLLIDTGIFMWGKPRLIALGAALAIWRQRREAGTSAPAAYALDRGGFKPAALDTVESIRHHLALLQPSPHPGSFLEALTHQENSPIQSDAEIILITHPAAQEALERLPIWKSLVDRATWFTLAIDRDGTLELTRHTPLGRRQLSQARVEAEDLLPPIPERSTNRGAPNPHSLTSESGRLPRFYRQQPWPLYHLALPVPLRSFLLRDHGFLGVSALGAICWWEARWGHRLRPGRILCPVAPKRHPLGLLGDATDKNRFYLLYPGNDSSSLEILVLSIEGKEDPISLHIPGRIRQLSDFRLQSGALVLKDGGATKAFSLHDGSLIASANTTYFAGSAWFDGETFHPLGDLGEPQDHSLIIRGAPARWAQKRHRLNGLVRAGFGVTGGLFLQSKSGRTYHLMTGRGVLEWKTVPQARARFQEFHPLPLADWPELDLSQATFPDGRRIVIDRLGFLHLCGAGDPSEELSLVLVKGSTAAWQRRGFHYGESSLLWGEPLGGDTVLAKLMARLCRACDPSRTQPAS